MKVLYIIRKEKSPYADVLVIYLGLFILKNGWITITVRINITVIVKKKREICASFAVASQITKIVVAAPGKCLDEMEKEINLYNKIFGERKNTTL